MKNKTYLQSTLLFVFALSLTACGGKLAITNVDFAQPLEIVMQSDAQANVSDSRTGLSFNVTELLNNEGITIDSFTGTEVRVIRNNAGFYFVTARGFKNVYVMETAESSLKAVNIIKISETGLDNPAFNQRSPFINLIDGSNSYALTRNGIN